MKTEQEQQLLFDQYSYIVHYSYKVLYKDDFVESAKEDIIQEGFLVLWRCCSMFDESLHKKFFSYAYAAIQNEMLRYIYRNRPHYYNYSLNEPVLDTYSEEEITLEDTLPEYEDLRDINTIITDILSEYRAWLNTTNVAASDKYILIRLYRAQIILTELVCNEKVTTRYIEQEYGINRTLVSKIFKEIREALQKSYPTRYNNGGNHGKNNQ